MTSRNEEILEKEGLLLRTAWPHCPGCGSKLSEATRSRDGDHYCAVCHKIVVITR